MYKTVNEKTALLSDAGGRVSGTLLAGAWGVVVLAVSASMVNLNKYLMQDGVFPYPVQLILLQFTFAAMLNGGLIMISPGLYPSLTAADLESKVTTNPKVLLRKVLPVAFAFVISVLASNMSYYYSSVPFLQMMKESNIITVYLMSLAIGTESFEWKQGTVLVCLAIATVGSISGEVHFSLAGFLLQAIACVADASKNIMAGILLGGGNKLDPMSFSFMLSPLVLGFTGLVCVLQHEVNNVASMPSQHAFLGSWQLLLGNAVLAFVLNLAIAMFLRHSTALSFGLLGIVKDILVVISSTTFLGASISHGQWASFAMQIVLLCTWTYMKMNN